MGQYATLRLAGGAEIGFAVLCRDEKVEE
jgi:hypothetical protein